MERWYKTGKELVQEIYETKGNENEVALWNIGQCGYILKYMDTILCIDPVLNDLPDGNGGTMRLFPHPFEAAQLKADYVLCTHGHEDHLAPETVTGFHHAEYPTRFVVPAGCRKLMDDLCIPGEEVTGLLPGESVQLTETIRVEAFSAAHPVHSMDPEDDQMALSYGIHFGDIFLVHLGDGYLTGPLFESLKAANPIQLLLPPINGDDYFREINNCLGNMEAEQAAKLAVALDVDLTIPTHYNMYKGNTVDPLRFAAELRRLDTGRRWRLPSLGERVIYRL